MQQEQSFDFQGLIGAAKRRWWIVLLPIVICAPIAAVVAFSLPATYSATARIAVITQQIPESLVRSTVTSTIEERISLIEQRLTTRQTLLDIAQRFDIGAGEGLSQSAVVRLMRASTDIRGIALRSGRGNRVAGVEITYSASQPRLAADVANEFQRRLLEQNLQQRTDRAFETLRFFRTERERLGEELASIEEEIAAFKIRNQASLPESLSSRRSELTALEQRAFDRELQELALQEQRSALLEALENGVVPSGNGRRALSPQERELERLRNALVQQSAVYADSHPSLRFLQNRIERLEQQIAAEPVEPAEAAPQPTADLPPDVERDVQGQIDSIDRQIEALAERRALDAARIVELADSIAQTPNVEMQLRALERQFAAAQSAFEDAVRKEAEAERGERLEVNQQAERFEVIETAAPPSRPDSPNRPLIVAAGVGVGGAIGFAIALLLEFLNRSIRTPEDLVRRLDLWPIASIPMIVTAHDLRARRRQMLAKVAVVLIGAPALIVAVDHYVMSIADIGRRVVDHLGADDLLRTAQGILGA